MREMPRSIRRTLLPGLGRDLTGFKRETPSLSCCLGPWKWTPAHPAVLRCGTCNDQQPGLGRGALKAWGSHLYLWERHTPSLCQHREGAVGDAWGAARQGEDLSWCPRATVPTHKLEESPAPRALAWRVDRVTGPETGGQDRARDELGVRGHDGSPDTGSRCQPLTKGCGQGITCRGQSLHPSLPRGYMRTSEPRRHGRRRERGIVGGRLEMTAV